MRESHAQCVRLESPEKVMYLHLAANDANSPSSANKGSSAEGELDV